VVGVTGLRGNDDAGARSSDVRETGVAQRTIAAGLGREGERVARSTTRSAHGEVSITEGLGGRRALIEGDQVARLVDGPMQRRDVARPELRRAARSPAVRGGDAVTPRTERRSG
jgi:hypothetical protein